MKSVHVTAYMLDPKFDKSIHSGEKINSAYAVITALSYHLGLDAGKDLGGLAKYKARPLARGWDLAVKPAHACIYLLEGTCTCSVHPPPNPTNIRL